VDSILDFVIHGANILIDNPADFAVTTHLSALENRLFDSGYRWTDVSLLILANSKMLRTHREQNDVDQSIIQGLTEFCDERNWFPSLLGSTVRSSFFRSYTEENVDISDGVLLVAVISDVLTTIPIAHSFGADNKTNWKMAGYQTVQKCVEAYSRAMLETHGLNLGKDQVQDSSTGLLFTSGSGYVTQEFIDFTDCYALGQELLTSWDDLKIVGGCSTNRTANQLQCIYYSATPGRRTQYRYTYSQFAAAALLPYASPRFLLLHPYTLYDDTPLRIEWHPAHQYAKGRYYYVRSINGVSPIDFFSPYWRLSREKLHQMCETHTPIPLERGAYGFTIASSISSLVGNIWPNAPVWLEKVGNEVMLRLVRAEAHDSNYYLMALGDGSDDGATTAIAANSHELQSYFQSYVGRKSTVLSFLCESRKYLLSFMDSNIEAELIPRLIPDHSQVAIQQVSAA
jgi:hypothetical protein